MMPVYEAGYHSYEDSRRELFCSDKKLTHEEFEEEVFQAAIEGFMATQDLYTVTQLGDVVTGEEFYTAMENRGFSRITPLRWVWVFGWHALGNVKSEDEMDKPFYWKQEYHPFDKRLFNAILDAAKRR